MLDTFSVKFHDDILKIVYERTDGQADSAYAMMRPFIFLSKRIKADNQKSPIRQSVKEVSWGAVPGPEPRL